MNRKYNPAVNRRLVDPALKKLIKQELCRTTDTETFRQNNRYDFDSLYSSVSDTQEAA